MIHRRTPFALVALLVLAGNLAASATQDTQDTQDTQNPQYTQPSRDAQADQALQRELEMGIMAPCCYGSPVGDHDSPAAKQVKTQIAGLIAEGKTKEEIFDMYVALYGEKILSSPKPTGFNMMAYFMPPIFLLLGGLFVIYFINRQVTPEIQPARVKEASYSDEFFKKIEQEMKELKI